MLAGPAAAFRAVAAFGALAALRPIAAFGPVGPLRLFGALLGGRLGSLLGGLFGSLLGGLFGGLLGLLGPLVGALGPFVGSRACCGRSSFTISVHRSVIPSPVAADTGRTGAFSCLVHLSRARRRSARESLSIFVATTAAVSGSDAVPVSSFRAAWVVSVEIQFQAATSCGRPGWRASTSCSTAAGRDAPPK